VLFESIANWQKKIIPHHRSGEKLNICLMHFEQSNLMKLLAASSEVSIRENLFLFVASDGELTQAPQPPSPSPEGEGVQEMRKLKPVGIEILVLEVIPIYNWSYR
jgi:hypothetical protein